MDSIEFARMAGYPDDDPEKKKEREADDRFGRNIAIAILAILLLGAFWLAGSNEPGADFTRPCGNSSPVDCE